MPNESDFLKNERPREFLATFAVCGEITVSIDAGSAEEAESAAQAMMDDDEFGLELDEVSDIRLDCVRKSKPLFLVLRDGSNMQVSRLKDGDIPRGPVSRLSDGDIPRGPDDRGF